MNYPLCGRDPSLVGWRTGAKAGFVAGGYTAVTDTGRTAAEGDSRGAVIHGIAPLTAGSLNWARRPGRQRVHDRIFSRFAVCSALSCEE